MQIRVVVFALGIKLHLLNENFIDSRTKDIKRVYFDVKDSTLAMLESSRRKSLSEDSSVVVLPEIQIADIDTQDDWEIAEIKYEILCRR